MKIIDDLSREEIPLSKIIAFCTNPVIESDNWHKTKEIIDHSVTRIVTVDCDTEYQMFALHDDGRREGKVWFPVTVKKE